MTGISTPRSRAIRIAFTCTDSSSSQQAEHVGDQGERRLIVDFSGVDYISSAGLLALDAVAGRTFAAGGALLICGLSEPVRLAFDLAGLAEHFSIEMSAAEAAATLSGR